MLNRLSLTYEGGGLVITSIDVRRVDLPLRCWCGHVRGRPERVALSAGFRFICCCKDCQTFARFLERPGALVPELWRDGIDAASGAAVALTISPMRPAADWVSTIGERLAGDEVVAGAIDPAEGLRLVAKGRIDVVLLDLSLPDSSGLERLLRRDDLRQAV